MFHPCETQRVMTNLGINILPDLRAGPKEKKTCKNPKRRNDRKYQHSRSELYSMSNLFIFFFIFGVAHQVLTPWVWAQIGMPNHCMWIFGVTWCHQFTSIYGTGRSTRAIYRTINIKLISRCNRYRRFLTNNYAVTWLGKS